MSADVLLSLLRFACSNLGVSVETAGETLGHNLQRTRVLHNRKLPVNAALSPVFLSAPKIHPYTAVLGINSGQKWLSNFHTRQSVCQAAGLSSAVQLSAAW